MFVPFVAGHLLQPWIGSWVQQRRKVLGGVDRGSVLQVVYSVFSGGCLSRLWHQLAFEPLIALFGVAGTRLGLMLAITALAARRLSFSREDEIAIVFCGSKKSFVAGIPKGTLSMANDELGWVFTSYIAASVITMPMTRWLAGRYGRKLVYQLSITGFALGLVLDTRAATPIQFVLARIVQGVSSGTLAPLSMAKGAEQNPPLDIFGFATFSLGMIGLQMLLDRDEHHALPLSSS
jgi:predicted Na+-dependent transporter